MKKALLQAKRAGDIGEVPVGAVIVKDGKIIEQGRHQELMKAKSHYFRLYTRQYEDEATSTLLGG